MASNSGWDKTLPLGTQAVSSGDDQIRAFKTHMEAWWEEEHYATDGSATSAGGHKLGSGRCYQGAAAPTLTDSGRMWHDTDDDTFWVSDGAAWNQVSSAVGLAVANVWTARQNFVPSSNNTAIAFYRTADTKYRLEIDEDGQMSWGDGTNNADTNLYRNGANQLRTDDSFICNSLQVGGVGAPTATISDFLKGSDTTDFGGGSIAAQGFASGTISVTGAAVGDTVICANPYHDDAFKLQVTGYVSAADTVTVVMTNVGSTSATPTSRALEVLVVKY
jgi:hypothetical protein